MSWDPEPARAHVITVKHYHDTDLINHLGCELLCHAISRVMPSKALPFQLRPQIKTRIYGKLHYYGGCLVRQGHRGTENTKAVLQRDNPDRLKRLMVEILFSTS